MKSPYIEIQPIGSFFETDSEGYIINPASTEKIQEEYKPVLEDIVKLYQQEFGSKLVSVYVRGSVAKGTALKGIADVDTFAIVDDISGHLERNWKELRNEYGFNTKYSQFEDIEMGATSLHDIGRSYKIVLHQSVVIYGNPIPVPQKKVTSEFAIHTPTLQRRFEKFDRMIEANGVPIKITSCTWFMKTLLRTGLELTLDRAHKYTRDLYPCYQIFSEYYPEKEPDMRKALKLALNPISDKTKLKDIRDTFGEWLLEECKRQEWKLYE